MALIYESKLDEDTLRHISYHPEDIYMYKDDINEQDLISILRFLYSRGADGNTILSRLKTFMRAGLSYDKITENVQEVLMNQISRKNELIDIFIDYHIPMSKETQKKFIVAATEKFLNHSKNEGTQIPDDVLSYGITENYDAKNIKLIMDYKHENQDTLSPAEQIAVITKYLLSIMATTEPDVAKAEINTFFDKYTNPISAEVLEEIPKNPDTLNLVTTYRPKIIESMFSRRSAIQTWPTEKLFSAMKPTITDNEQIEFLVSIYAKGPTGDTYLKTYLPITKTIRSFALGAPAGKSNKTLSYIMALEKVDEEKSQPIDFTSLSDFVMFALLRTNMDNLKWNKMAVNMLKSRALSQEIIQAMLKKNKYLEPTIKENQPQYYEPKTTTQTNTNTRGCLFGWIPRVLRVQNDHHTIGS